MSDFAALQERCHISLDGGNFQVNAAETPFEFVTVSYLTRIGNQSACTLAELLTGLENCSDASIFHHAYQTLGSHHFLTEGFSNDFAQWVLSDANRNDLAEQLAALDIRDYVSIAALRRDLCRLVADFCTAFPHFAGQSALERFYFCESVEVTAPLGRSARTLDEFRDGIAHLSHAGFYFISSLHGCGCNSGRTIFRTGCQMDWGYRLSGRASITLTFTPSRWTARAPSCCG